MRAAELDLDLDVFAGPFDLLMTVILRDEVALAEIGLGEVVVAYLDRVDERGELELESATEFLVLIAALLELKSRLLLPAADDEELPQLAPEEAADELLARMLEYRRYRDAGVALAARFASERGFAYRSAALPPALRRISLDAARPVYRPERLADAIGGLLRMPAAPDTSHIRPTVSLQRRLGVLRELLRGGGDLDFDDAFGRDDRLTQAVTIFALLELHKRGEATWEQPELFGPIRIASRRGAASATGAA